MRARTILTLVLAAFVIVSVIAVVKQAKTATPSTPSARPAAIPIAKATPATLPAAPAVEAKSTPPRVSSTKTAKAVATPAEPKAPVRRIVAMYFHGDVRCATCRKVEAYAKEAVESGFGPQIEAGLVEFRAINVEAPGNRHFVDDFQLVSRSVVVIDEADGEVQRFVKLDNVWGLVGNHDAYLSYVQDAVRGYLETL